MAETAKAWELFLCAPGGNGDTADKLRFRRCKVPSGWLVASDEGDRLGPITFVPDPQHAWNPRV